ncbi:outer membrane protein assembly factor BamD, partial [Candidatus Dependentiae bacterium]
MLTKSANNYKIKIASLALFPLILAPGCSHQAPSKRKQDVQAKKIEKALRQASSFAPSTELRTTEDRQRTGKAFRDLDYEELKRGKNRLLSEGRKELAIKHIEKMIPLCNDVQELRSLRLEEADLFFETGDLKKAEQFYSEFVQLYPGDQNIEYASYKSILSNYWLTLDAERDQSVTKNTIALSKNFLDRSNIFKEYTSEVEKICLDCQNILFKSEISICKDYINRGDYLSARTRLANIEK